ncbi:protein lethal(2)essential for life-like [Microplitis mediator]|uniref:protein lethal(2)essential for life-like n=1 Tax=Microplitis mediator TaxID=375433 RepID=UPI002556D224|nr:protein lethal(2)essential for life-like [Microplitis mediator]
MSLLPLLYSNWWEDLDAPHSLLDQDFGLGVRPESMTPRSLYLYLQQPKSTSRCPINYNRPWGELLRKGQGGASTVKADKDSFHVSLDVQQFSPEEINVKVIDRSVVVEGKHEEKQDEHGFISRQFTRRYLIPEQCDIDQVTSKLSSDGVLSIVVPRKDQPKIEGERKINIEHTGKPAIRESAPEAIEKKAEA